MIANTLLQGQVVAEISDTSYRPQPTEYAATQRPQQPDDGVGVRIMFRDQDAMNNFYEYGPRRRGRRGGQRNHYEPRAHVHGPVPRVRGFNTTSIPYAQRNRCSVLDVETSQNDADYIDESEIDRVVFNTQNSERVTRRTASKKKKNKKGLKPTHDKNDVIDDESFWKNLVSQAKFQQQSSSPANVTMIASEAQASNVSSDSDRDTTQQAQ